VARLTFDEDVRATLRDFPWAFATRYETLVLVKGPATGQTTVQQWSAATAYEVGHVVESAGVAYYCLAANTGQLLTNPGFWTTTAPERVNGDWLYAYRAPATMIAPRRVINPLLVGRGREWDPEPPEWRYGSDDTFGLIYTNELNAELEFTHMSPCVAFEGDALFRSALAWRHAHSIAPVLSRDEKKVLACWQMYAQTLKIAERAAATEVQDDDEGDAEWVAGRN
jgi:hypothetical protein